MGWDAGAVEGGNESRQDGPFSPPLPRSRAVLLRRLAWLAVALIVPVLLTIILRPGSEPNGINLLNLVPFQHKWPAVACILQGCREAKHDVVFLLVEVLGNLVVFVPFGAALAVATLPPRAEGRTVRNLVSRWWLRIVAAGFLLSLSIELTQLFIPGHTTDVDDVIFNTLGAAIGASLVWGLYRLTSNH